MEKVKISLKFKILGGISLLLVLSIGTSVYFANDLVSKDKKAYVYETGLREAESLSQQLLEQIRNTAEKGILYSVIDKTSPDKVNKIVNSDRKLILFSIYGSKGSEQDKITEVTNDTLIEELADKYNFKASGLSSELLSSLVSKIRNSRKKLIIESFTRELGIPSLAILLRNDESKEVYLFISSLKEIAEIAGEDKLFKKYIVDNKGISYFLGKKLTNINLGRVLKTKGFKGTIETMSKDKSKQMTSYVRYKDYNINIISSISKSKALSVITDLQYRSLLFGVCLLSLSVIFGIFFASKISHPLKQLLEGTKNLSKGVFDKEIVVKTNDEIALLSNSFNFMSREIGDLLENKEVMIEELEKAKLQLEDYSKNLETKVEERTLELRQANNFIEAMINSLDQGLMVFGRDTICKPFYTSACVSMFGESPSDRAFYDVIGLKETEQPSFKSWSEIIFSEKLPFDSAKDLGPKNKTFGSDYTDENFKFISLEYFPMKNDDDKIENIVAVATDKTQRVKAEGISKEKEAYALMIIRIINNKKQFISFMKESETILQNILSEFENEIPRVDYIMMNFHSLNGGLGIYHIDKLQSQARFVETQIADFKKEPQNEDIFMQELNELALNFKREFFKFKDECALFVGGSIDEESGNIVITKEVKEEFFKKIKQINNKELLGYFEEYFVKTPVVEGFKAYEDLVETVSQKLNKSISPIAYKGQGMRLDMTGYEDFFNTLVHLFRNCVDHGIESPNERVEAGKDPQGVIGVHFEKKKQEGKDYLLVEVVDDGRGINPEAIREKLKNIPGSDSYINEPDEDIIYHIFDESFSTRDEVTSISGRGVGMSAIKDIITEKNGHIFLESEVGKGSKFQFYLPYI